MITGRLKCVKMGWNYIFPPGTGADSFSPREWKIERGGCVRITNGSAAATVKFDRAGVAHVTSSGLLTRGSSSKIRLDSAAVVAERRGAGVIHRLDRAVIAFGIDIMASPSPSGRIQEVPVALVVSPDNLPMMTEYCRRAGAIGMIRRAFTDAERARAWMQAQIQMMAVLQAMRVDQARR